MKVRWLSVRENQPGVRIKSWTLNHTKEPGFYCLCSEEPLKKLNRINESKWLLLLQNKWMIWETNARKATEKKEEFLSRTTTQRDWTLLGNTPHNGTFILGPTSLHLAEEYANSSILVSIVKLIADTGLVCSISKNLYFTEELAISVVQ